MVRVSNIIEAMEGIAPPSLAEAWDNCGLQIGSRHWPVQKIWVALDPLFTVIEAASEQGVDMVITHHPLLFHPLRDLDVDSPIGKTVERAITARIAIYSAHTNLDSAPKGVNAVLANRLGLIDSVVLSPALGVDSAAELKGLGRIGYLREKQTLHQLAISVKSALSLQMVKVVGNRSVPVRQVALCSGSGGSLLDAFFRSEAQVYLSGDLSYHDARNVEDHGRMMIDIGHFGSERWIIDAVANQLREIMGQFNWPTVIEACELEKDPFIFV